MTEPKQPDALRLADWCEKHSSGIYRPSADAAAELRRLHAENTTLQQGYDAARLEIEALRMRNVEPAGEYLPLPVRYAYDDEGNELFSAAQMFNYVDADRAMRAQAAPAARNAAERDALLQAAIDFIRTLTGMTPPPIEVAPPEVFAPFRAFVDRVQAITREYSLPAPVAQGDALTYEQSYAIRQGHEIASSDAYFEARPQIDNNDRRGVFRAGFDRGWDAARSQAKKGAHP